MSPDQFHSLSTERSQIYGTPSGKSHDILSVSGKLPLFSSFFYNCCLSVYVQHEHVLSVNENQIKITCVHRKKGEWTAV